MLCRDKQSIISKNIKSDPMAFFGLSFLCFALSGTTGCLNCFCLTSKRCMGIEEVRTKTILALN